MDNSRFSLPQPLPRQSLSQQPAQRSPASNQPPKTSPDAYYYLSSIMWAAVATVVIVLLGTIVLVAGYIYIASGLPSVVDLEARSASFKSTKIYDRNGELLYEIIDPTGGRRTVVALKDIPKSLIWATIATEDATFYRNPGFNPFAIARALYQNLSEGEVVSGASGVTQQLAKNLYLTRDKNLNRKIKEAVLAAEITRRYSKDQILEIYLNEFYYGNLAYGVGSAAEAYFGKRVQDLTLAEAAFIAGLPQSTILYDPYVHLEAAKARRAVVLDLMVKEGYITTEQAEKAKAEPLQVRPQVFDIKAPHFVMYVRQLLEQRYGTGLLYRSGLQVYTTLDLKIQNVAEKVARDQIAAIAKQKASNASIVALNPKNGEILAMVGSVDYFNDKIAGQVNVSLSPRQPGSTIKPVIYAAAFERGWDPATMVMDVRTEYPNGNNPPYVPVNYDGKEHGPVSVRTALACSYNVPAVQTLYTLGLPAALEMTQRLGIRSLNRADYGLSLVLGGGETTLMEMVNAYAVFANQGTYVPANPILRITDYEGKAVSGGAESRPIAPERVLDPRYAYMITNILSDNAARMPAFGPQSYLVLSRPAAAKTGTTDDYRDAWVIGYTPDFVAGVWVGNSDGSPMQAVPGVVGAGPIWHEFMEQALAGQPARQFERPAGLVEVPVCPVSGYPRTADCPPERTDLFLEEAVPKDACPVHTVIKICRVSNQLATDSCPADQIEERHFTAFPLANRRWAEERGLPQPPIESCSVHAPGTRVEITYPIDGQTVGGIVGVQGTAQIADFKEYILEYGISHDPGGWGRVANGAAPVENGVLGQWDTRKLQNGPHTIRVLVFNKQDKVAERRVRVFVYNLTTPTATPSPRVSPTPTRTSTVLTATPTASATAIWTATWTLTPLSLTATSTATRTHSTTPTSPGTITPGPTLIFLPTRTLTPTPAPPGPTLITLPTLTLSISPTPKN